MSKSKKWVCGNCGFPHNSKEKDKYCMECGAFNPWLGHETHLPDKERVTKPIKPRGKTCVNIPILGHRDPRGPDNNIRVWVDDQDKLHIRVEKTERCYRFEKVIEEDGYVEVIAG